MKALCCENKKLTEKFVDLAKFLRVIGEENRLKILCLLKDSEHCVCEIVENLGLPQNLVSTHLKALKDLRLVKNRQEGKRIYYFISKKTFKKYNSLLTLFLKNYE